MPKAGRQPWKATARTLVLYNPHGEWRFAIYGDAGILDGRLPDDAADVQTAQSNLLARVEEVTERRYAATWTQTDQHWWTADLTIQQ